jgi:hypothetical protein
MLRRVTTPRSDAVNARVLFRDFGTSLTLSDLQDRARSLTSLIAVTSALEERRFTNSQNNVTKVVRDFAEQFQIQTISYNSPLEIIITLPVGTGIVLGMATLTRLPAVIRSWTRLRKDISGDALDRDRNELEREKVRITRQALTDLQASDQYDLLLNRISERMLEQAADALVDIERVVTTTPLLTLDSQTDLEPPSASLDF